MEDDENIEKASGDEKTEVVEKATEDVKGSNEGKTD